jgi:hypothetical protein
MLTTLLSASLCAGRPRQPRAAVPFEDLDPPSLLFMSGRPCNIKQDAFGAFGLIWLGQFYTNRDFQ